jgi:hypothetical protein
VPRNHTPAAAALLAGPKQSGLLSLAQHLHLLLLTIGYHIAAADSMRCAHHDWPLSAT